MTIDSVIVGGGMVGATLALAIQEESVTLIDAAPLTTREDPRLIALTYASASLFQNLGVWQTLSKHATPIHQVHVSHRGKFGITRIHHQDVDLPTLGYLVPAKYINAALDEQLKQRPNVTIIRPATLKNLTQEESGVTLTIEQNHNETKLFAKKVIGCDGTASTVRALLNIATEEIDYEQSAIVTITNLSRDHQHIAYERFLKAGAIAMLPMTDQRVATIWTDQNTTIANLMALSDPGFLSELQTAFGYRLGRLQAISKRHVFPLHFIKAKETLKQHVILIGNAAHTIHPVAAQGLNIALYEVAELAEMIHAKQPLRPLKGNPVSLKLSHQLNAIFSNDFFMVQPLRSVGMIGFDISSRAKAFFMKKTLGRRGRSPDLLREKEIYENISSEH